MKFPLLPRRKNTDKRDYGHALIIAGSIDYPGAAIIAAKAVLLSGAGLVTLATFAPKSLMKRLPPEVMPVFLGLNPIARILKLVRERRINVVAIGPGLGRDPETSAFVRRLVRVSPVPVVLDADGLNAFEGRAKGLLDHKTPLVLTPHAGEFRRLFGQALPPEGAQRAALAKRLSKSYDVFLVLKGHRTLVVYGDKVRVNTTGNPGMAKGGSGDALTGILAAFIAQGLGPFEASVWAAHFHGKAGDLAVKRTGELSLTASDLIDSLKDCWSSSVGRAADL